MLKEFFHKYYQRILSEYETHPLYVDDLNDFIWVSV